MMIHAKELRVGNKVFYKPWDNKIAQNQIVTISWVSDNEAGYYEQHEASYPHAESEYSPIPLTPEILEKCGFVKDRNGWQMQGTQFSLTEQFFPCWLDRMLWPQDIPDFKQSWLKYLHQLQNLYFALTGQELTIKP